MSDLRKKILKKTLPPPSFYGPSSWPSDDDFEPDTWKKYFDKKEMNEDGFCVYSSGNSGPYIFFLHGAGLCALSFSYVAVCIPESFKVFLAHFHLEDLKEGRV